MSLPINSVYVIYRMQKNVISVITIFDTYNCYTYNCYARCIITCYGEISIFFLLSNVKTVVISILVEIVMQLSSQYYRLIHAICHCIKKNQKKNREKSCVKLFSPIMFNIPALYRKIMNLYMSHLRHRLYFILHCAYKFVDLQTQTETRLEQYSFRRR